MAGLYFYPKLLQFLIMKVPTETEISRPLKTYKKNFKRHGFLLTALLVIFIWIGTAGCGPRIARIPVSPEDLVKSNEYVKEGTEYYKNNDYYAALIKFLMAGDLNPNSAYISNYIGVTYLSLEYYEQAIEAFQRSMALNSKYPSSINNLGSAYFANGDYKKAEKYFKKAIKMKDDEPSFHLNMGTLYFEMKKTEKALSEWRTSLSLDPEILSKDDSISVSISGDNISLKDRYYFMARLHATAGNILETIKSLENALINGFSDIKAIRTHTDFDPVREDERFIKFMEDAKAWDKSQ